MTSVTNYNQLHKESELELKQLNESNSVQGNFKARMTQGNRKHKNLFRGSSHRSTPRLHLREGFPLSTEDALQWSTEDPSTELSNLQ